MESRILVEECRILEEDYISYLGWMEEPCMKEQDGLEGTDESGDMCWCIQRSSIGRSRGSPGPGLPPTSSGCPGGARGRRSVAGGAQLDRT